MDPIREQKCPGCGAAMRFDPKQGKLVCDYCGSTMEIPQAEQPVETTLQGLDFDALSAQASDPHAQALPVYNCVSCGAEVIVPAEQAALTCPYCGNNIVLTDKVTGALRPDGVVPFRIEKKDLSEAMTRFYKDKVLLPRNFFSDSAMSKVTGVYVPFWVFDGTLSGTLSFRADRTGAIYRQGDYEVTEIEHFRLLRDVTAVFKDLPVDASGRIDDALMDSLEPFDMADVKPFDMRYLAGFTADRFDRMKDDMAQRAKGRMLSTADSMIASHATSGYEHAVRTGGDLNASLKARYLLLPVYLFDLTYGGKTYHFALNGQTGKVVGEVPTDKGLSRAHFFKRALPAAAAVLLYSFVRYMMGG